MYTKKSSEFDDNYDDQSTPGTASRGNGIDPTYAEQYGAGLGDEVAERRTALEPVPNFPFYVVRFRKAIASFTNQKGSPRIQAQVEIVEGPGDTVGRVITDSGGIYFIVNRESMNFKTKELDVLSDEDFAKKLTNRKKYLNRIAKTLNFSLGVPVNFEMDALEAYAEQFNENAPLSIIEIRQEKGFDGVQRNKLVFESIETLITPMKDKKGNLVPGKTALDEARAKIAERDKATVSKGRSRTAGAVGRPSTPTSY